MSDHLIEMKHARILYNEEFDETTGRYKITDLIVAEFNFDDFEEAEKRGEKGSSVWPMYLYRTPDNTFGYSKDFGNCLLTTWHSWRPIDIIIDLFVFHEFFSIAHKDNAYKQIMKIKEVREVMQDYKYTRISIY